MQTLTRRSIPAWLWCVGVGIVFIGLAWQYQRAVPLGEGPDEPGHMRYVLFLAGERRLPIQRQPYATSDVPGEGHQPPLAYLLAAPTAAWLAPAQRTLALTSNPRFTWSGGDQAAAFMRGSNQYPPRQDEMRAWQLARLLGIPLGVLTLVGVWGSARLLSPHDHWFALLATMLVATLPQFLFMSALVTNDTLLTTLSAVLLWVCLALLNGGPQSPRSTHLIIVAGVLCALALLTKQSALLLLPLVAAVVWIVGGLRGVGWWAAITAGGAGWWYLRNVWLYGDLFGLQSFRESYTTAPMQWTEPAAWGAAIGQLFRSTWALFGWVNLPAPAWVYALYIGVVLLAAIMGGCAGIRGQGAGREMYGSGTRRWYLWLPVLALPLLALLWLFSFAAVAGVVAWQGRLLFPALAAGALLLAGGLRALPVRVLVPLLAVLIGVAAWLPHSIIGPAYQWYTLPPAQAQQQRGQPTYARFAAAWEQGVELHGWELDPAVPRAGDDLHLRLTWHALEPVPRDWTVFIHLVERGDGDTIVAQSNSRPQQGQFPTTLWTAGDWLRDTHTIALPATLAPATYTVRVGLYRPRQSDPRRGTRQAVWAADGQPLGTYTDVGTVQVR
ncbi:MAG: glycosyltransferase family 39 protein [Chloroflexaceae bacterium]|nr:glycosyltransferase family 39 protein [Chloroflexaceae bacterium]